jgi:hypothetical protein
LILLLFLADHFNGLLQILKRWLAVPARGFQALMPCQGGDLFQTDAGIDEVLAKLCLNECGVTSLRLPVFEKFMRL